MTSIPPSLPPTGPSSSPIAAAITATVLSEVPGPLAALPANAIIDATIAGPGQARGVVEVQTPMGALQLKLPLSIPAQASLQLQVVTSGGNPQLRVLSINGQAVLPNGQFASGPLAGAARLAPGIASGAGFVAATNAVRDPAGPAQTAENTASATVGRDPPAGRGIMATIVYSADPAMPRGSIFPVRIASLQLPGPAGGAFPQPAPGEGQAPFGRPLLPQSSASAVYAAYDDNPGPISGTAAESGAAGNQPPATPERQPTAVPSTGARTSPEWPVRHSDGVQPPAADGAAPPSAADTTGENDAPPIAPPAEPGPVSTSVPTGTPPAAATVGGPLSTGALPDILAGVVAPNSHAGQPLVQTAMGLLSLAGLDLPPGTHVDLVPMAPPQAAQPTPDAPRDAGEASQRTWAALDEAIEVLRQADSAAAEQMMRRLPDLGPRLGPALIALASAVQSGNVRSWLGDGTVKALERAGRRDLLDQLDDDVSGLKTAVTIPAGGDWQSLVLPLPLGERIEPIRLTVRRPPENDDEWESRQDEGTRFLVDVAMSRLGALQLDGLVKRKSKRFDLIVRSHSRLSDDLQRDISGIFARALDGLGMTGSASFLEAVHFIEPIPIDRGRAAGLMI